MKPTIAQNKETAFASSRIIMIKVEAHETWEIQSRIATFDKPVKCCKLDLCPFTTSPLKHTPHSLLTTILADPLVGDKPGDGGQVAREALVIAISSTFQISQTRLIPTFKLYQTASTRRHGYMAETFTLVEIKRSLPNTISICE